MRSFGTRIQRSALDFLTLPFVDRLVDLIKDVKSSNGTFINDERPGPESLENQPYKLKSDDIVARTLFYST
jgi:pSer/pThr/pTyr-binding forkhead associated (FHA) protein